MPWFVTRAAAEVPNGSKLFNDARIPADGLFPAMCFSPRNPPVLVYTIVLFTIDLWAEKRWWK